MDYDVYETEGFGLQSGVALPMTRLAYKTHGTLSPGKDNVIVYPSRYAGTLADQDYLIGPGMALDPEKYFIMCLNMMGSGLSSSPSNTPAPFDGPRFPKVTQYDNVRLQAQMLREVFGIEQIALAVGWSMGGDVPRSGGGLVVHVRPGHDGSAHLCLPDRREAGDHQRPRLE